MLYGRAAPRLRRIEVKFRSLPAEAQKRGRHPGSADPDACV